MTLYLSPTLFLPPLSPVKCIRDTPAYFAERLHKAMKVRLLFPVLMLEGEREGGAGGCTERRGRLTVVLTGGRDQGQDPHPHHGVPLWGRHAGHQTGLRQDLWEITLQRHLGQLALRSVSQGWCGGHLKGIWHHLCFRCQGDTSGDYKKLLLKLCGGSD